MKAFIYKWILPPIIWFIIQLWCRTIRTKILNPELDKKFRTEPGRAVLTLWHSHLFYLTYHYRGNPHLCIFVSPSSDGDLIANVGKMFGYKVVRGSSFKNTIPGTRDCIKLLRREYKVGVIADGSRGPRHQAQPGTVQLSRITNSPVYALTWYANFKYEFSSWDKFILPLPFSKVTLNFGSPIILPPDADKETIQQKQDELTHLLNQLTEECEQH
jgi:hypothetical protein